MAAGSIANGSIQIRLDLHNAVQQLEKLNATLKSVSDKATTTNQKIAGLSTSLRAQTQHLRAIRDATQSAVRVNNEMLTAMYGVLGQIRTLNQAYQQQTQILNQLAQSGNRASQSIMQQREHTSSLISSLTSLAVAFGATTSAVDLFKNSLNVTKELDSINKTFYAITGSMNGANMEMSYVREMAQGLGLDFMSLAKSYKGFSAATKFANMDMSTSKEIFESVAGASTVLGLSGQKTELVLMALEQMVSKGVVSMEELRRQLGDQLPGAFELGAKAMNMGLAEFNKFVSTGQLMTEDFLPRFARTLKETYATVENIGLAVKTPRAEIQKLQNELLFMQDTFARQGFLQPVIAGVRELTASLQTQEVRQNVIQLGHAFGVVVQFGMEFVKFLAEHTTAIKNLLIVYASWKIAVSIMSKLLATVAGSCRTFALAADGATGSIGRMGSAAAATNNWIAKFGGLIAGLAGPVAGLVAIALTLTDALGETSTAFAQNKEFADKFGVSAGEAEAQLAIFLSTATKTDPLVRLTKQLDDLNARLQDIRTSADIGIEKMIDSMTSQIKDMRLSDVVVQEIGEGLTDIPEVAISKFVDEQALQQQSDKAKTILLNAFAQIREGSLTTGKSIATYLKGVKEALMTEAGDTKMAWEPVFQYIEQAAIAALSTWEQKRQVLMQFKLKEVNEDWYKFVNLTEEAKKGIEAVGKATKNNRFGKDMEADIKSFESVMKLVDKYYAKSEEGVKKQYDNTLAQIDNAHLMAEAWAETGKLKIELERAMLGVEIERTKAQLAASEQRIRQAESESEYVSEAVYAEVKAYRVLLEAQNAAVGGLDAQLANITKRVQEVTSKIPEARKAAVAEMEKTLKKNGFQGSGGSGRRSSGGAGKRDQTSLQSLAGEADKARTALQKLQDRHAELVAKLEGDSFAAQLAKINKQATSEVNTLDNSLKKLVDRYNSMSAGPQKEAARKELDTVKELIEQQKIQIEQNAEVERQMVRINQQLASYSEAAERAKNAGDFTEYWAQKQAQLNMELERMPKGTAGREAKEQEERMARMRKEWDLLGLASAQMDQWMLNTAQSVQDSFANIIPNALDTTIGAFSTMFTDILYGTKSAGDAWQAFTQTIQNMGKQIINTIIQIAIKMMVLKSFSMLGGLFAEDGAVVDGNSVQTAANGRVVGAGSGVRMFASGGILTSPQLFSTNGGQPVVAGEAGPEAFVPLGRTREGKLGIETTGGVGLGGGTSIMIVNVYNNASDNVQTRQEQSKDQNGNLQLDVFIDQIDAALAKKVGQGRSALGRSIDKTRGTSTSKALYS